MTRKARLKCAKPVSYTHLDVYKRQTEVVADEVEFLTPRDRDGAGYGGAPSPSESYRGGESQAAVSYTHLECLCFAVLQADACGVPRRDGRRCV